MTDRFFKCYISFCWYISQLSFIIWSTFILCHDVFSCALLRWGNLPVDDALQFEHDDVVKILKDYQQVYVPGKGRFSRQENPSLDTIEVKA